MNTTCDRIRNYINETLLAASDVQVVRDDEDLLQLLDSLQILRMLMELESLYSIKVDNSELTPDNLGTVERLAAFFERKAREPAPVTAAD